MEQDDFISVLLQQNMLLLEQVRELTKAVNVALTKVPSLGVTNADYDSSGEYSSAYGDEEGYSPTGEHVVILPALSEDQIAQIEREELGQNGPDDDRTDVYDTIN